MCSRNDEGFVATKDSRIRACSSRLNIKQRLIAKSFLSVGINLSDGELKHDVREAATLAIT